MPQICKTGSLEAGEAPTENWFFFPHSASCLSSSHTLTWVCWFDSAFGSCKSIKSDALSPGRASGRHRHLKKVQTS